MMSVLFCRATVPVAVAVERPSNTDYHQPSSPAKPENPAATRRLEKALTRQRTPKLRSQARSAGAFTLIEVLLASVAAAMVLVIVYSVFTSVIHLRDNSTARVRQTRLRARASAVLRRDLQGAIISGGLLANTLEGDSAKASTVGSSANAGPGYLRMTTTTGRDSGTTLYGDVQEVEYHLTRDANTSDPAQGSTLVRTVTRDLLAANTLNTPQEETLLTNVASLQVSFYDGAAWQESWQATPTTDGASQNTTPTAATAASSTAPLLPQAIRVDIRQAAPTPKDPVPPLLEVLVPWTTQPFTTPTPTPTPS